LRTPDSLFRGSLRLSVAAFVTLLVIAVAPAVASATTYYVSPAGHDNSSGKSEANAWRTLYRVNKANLRPGDRVLFQAGQTFDDMALQPGWGTGASGTASAPIVFGTYGAGRATLPQGIWLKGERHLIFQDFNLENQQGVEGTGSDDTINECDFSNFTSVTEIAINVIGTGWVIENNDINNTGDSGMLLRGSHFLVTGNTITNTGLDPRITYGSHGIYLKAADSKVIGNTITNFHDDGVSVRYPNSVVKDNTISGGAFGIAWFQYDSARGTSRWTDNTISYTRIAAIYVSPYDIGGRTDENFIIHGNKIYRPDGSTGRVADTGGWLALVLSHDRGRYHVSGNRVV
jgi:hypothetical protein